MRRIAIFPTTRDVVTSEELCRDAKIKVSVVPTPKSFSKNCGMSLAFDAQDEQRFVELMKNNNTDVTIYRQESF